MSGLRSQFSLAAHLQSTKPPWTILLVLKKGRGAESAIKVPAGFLVKVVHGNKCRDSAALFAEMAEALEFPDYFGHNWDALEECLADLEWLPAKGYVLLFTEAERILSDDEDAFSMFVEVLNDAAEGWAAGEPGKRAKPFHAALAVSERNSSKRTHWGVPQVAVPPTGHRPTGKSR
ncbi:MAG TPA: barstar family protein [Nitrospira sp.]|nr:barstar family protein [Nitrospira sp.]